MGGTEEDDGSRGSSWRREEERKGRPGVYEDRPDGSISPFAARCRPLKPRLRSEICCS